jgi:transcriptional regulator with XRE-family HTH domain
MTTIADRVKRHNSHLRKILREKLKQARLEADYKQAEVAYILGWSQSYLSKIEDGDGRIDFVRLERLAAVYNKPLAWFATLDPDISNPTSYAEEGEPCYDGQTRKEWKLAAKHHHWPVPRGWGHEWLRKKYDFSVRKYKASSEYRRIAGGEDFWSVFKWDGKGYIVTAPQSENSFPE